MNKRRTRTLRFLRSTHHLHSCKRSQFQLSFSMIFSIILILAFIGVAIYALVWFINLNRCSQTGLFKNDFQNKIDTVWNSPEALDVFPGIDKGLTSVLPSTIQYICFVDFNSPASGGYRDFYEEFDRYYKGLTDSPNNVVFYPPKKVCEGQRGFKLDHIDIENITHNHNPYCIPNQDQTRIELEKELKGNNLVKVRQNE